MPRYKCKSIAALDIALRLSLVARAFFYAGARALLRENSFRMESYWPIYPLRSRSK
jgi:hypothetical protein